MTLESPILLDLGFKGDRTYVQAGDFVDAVNSTVAPHLGGFLARMTFQRFARNACELNVGATGNADRPVARGVWNTDRGEIALAITETDTEIACRRPYDESLIAGPARMEGRSVTGPHENPYSTIENVIALTKKLNYSLTPDVSGKWVVGRVDLSSALPEHWTEIVIESVSVTAGAFSRNRIRIDGDDIGEMRFIAGQP